ncbi:MAG: hypothetical protein JO031_04650 [Ktedonobacteraceae bacterium]|nr:hypothetical protein [Ktedonobacteraceae bacterium]
MRASWVTWVWPILILLSTLAVTLVTFLFPEVEVRPEVIMGFLFVIPGLTVVRFFRFKGPAIEWMFAFALSFTIDAFVAGIVLYAGQWSPKNIISFLLGFCFSGAVAQLVIIRPVQVDSEPRLLTIEEVVTVDLGKTGLSAIEEAVTVDLSEFVPSTIEDEEITIDLSKSVSSNSKNGENTEAGIHLKKTKDTEDTQTRLAVLPKFQQLPEEDTQEKTIVLDKPELLGKGSLKGC